MSSRLFVRKSVETLQREAGDHGLKRTLSPLNVMLLGVGCILGAGIYVMTGTAAANFAGPAVVLSFGLAGLACALTALCYAELASTMPVSGSAYTYCYASLGEVFAWGIGWLLLLEYGMAGATLAVGFSGYLVSFLKDFGVIVPPVLSTPFMQVSADGVASLSGGVNVVAASVILLVTLILARGVSESALVNNLLVAIKVAVLAAFVAIGVGAVNPDNWTPFIPANEGGFHYGVQGVFRGASLLFFAYLGFETVSTAASEAKNPEKAMPIGILGALAICTLIYVVVAVVLTGVVPFRELGVPDPIAVAADRMGKPQVATLIKLGALTGLASVLLVNLYGQTRVAFAMGRDGLLPDFICKVHPKFQTPHLGTILFGLISAFTAAFVPLSVLGDLVSLGTALAFSVVCASLMWLRSTKPDLPRPFSVPLGGFWIGKAWIGFVPVAAIIMCWVMVVPVGLDVLGQAVSGNPLPAIILVGYSLAGVLIYAFYGIHRSRVAAGTAPAASEA
jgi:APA family basic amino acid/polyamine antiporter